MLYLLLLLPGFSELLPDPTGLDNNQEYVEIAWNEQYEVWYPDSSNTSTFNESENKTALEMNESDSTNDTDVQAIPRTIQDFSFILADDSGNDTAEFLTMLGNGSLTHLLFVEEGFVANFSTDSWNHSCAVFTIGSTIGNNLGNTEDALTLFITENGTERNESISANLFTEYVVSGCASGGGCSLSRNNSDNSWTPTPPTPCAPNQLPDSSAPIHEDNCTLSILADSIYLAGETITYKPLIEPRQDTFMLTYWWEDVYGSIVKDAQETTNTNEKRYTPKQPPYERDWVLLAKMRLDACNETLTAEKMVVMKGILLPELSCPAQTCSASNTGRSVTPKKSIDPPVLAAVLPGLVTAEEPFSVTATLYNDQPTPQMFAVSAYVYRGSKNYTSREPQSLKLDGLSEAGTTFELLMTEPGNYSVKIKAVREGRKTPYEEKRSLVVQPHKKILTINESFTQVSSRETSNTTQEPPLVAITGAAVAAEGRNTGLLLAGAIAAGLLFFSRRRSAADDS